MKPHTSTTHSKDLDRFVVRVPKDLHAAMKMLAKHHGRSVNAEYLQALSNYLNGQARVMLLKSILADRAGAALSQEVLSRVALVDGHDSTSGIMKFVIRYADNTQQQMKDAANAIKRPYVYVIMSSLTWWLNISNEISSLFAAIEGKEHAPVSAHSLGHLTNAFLG